MGAGGVRAVLQFCAHPHAHAVAVAGVAGHTVFIPPQPQLGGIRHSGAKPPQHRGVAHVIAGAQHHAFLRGRPQVAPRPGLGHSALHAAIRAAQQLYHRRVAQALHPPRLHCQAQVPPEHRDMGGAHPGGGLVAPEPLGAVFKGFGARAAAGLQPALRALGRRRGRGPHHRNAGVPLQIPVKGLSRLVRPAPQNALARLVRHVPHQIVHDLHLVHLAPAPHLGHAAVHHRKIARAGLGRPAFFQQDHRAAQLGRGPRRGHARKARAHHHHVGFQRFLNLALADFGRRAQPCLSLVDRFVHHKPPCGRRGGRAAFFCSAAAIRSQLLCSIIKRRARNATYHC